LRSDPGAEVLVGFRPESLQIVVGSDRAGHNAFDGVLRSSTFLSDQFVYEAFIKDLLVTGKSRVIPACDDRRMRLYVDPAEIMVFPYAESKDRVLASEQRG
jgi:hypothetical protein